MNFFLIKIFLFALFANICLAAIEGCDPRSDRFQLANEECNEACITANCSYGYCSNSNSHREFACKCVGSRICNNGQEWLDH